jgi:hypothetical protein
MAAPIIMGVEKSARMLSRCPQQPGSPALWQSMLNEPGPSSYIQKKSDTRELPIPAAQLEAHSFP